MKHSTRKDSIYTCTLWPISYVIQYFIYLLENRILFDEATKFSHFNDYTNDSKLMVYVQV